MSITTRKLALRTLLAAPAPIQAYVATSPTLQGRWNAHDYTALGLEALELPTVSMETQQMDQVIEQAVEKKLEERLGPSEVNGPMIVAIDSHGVAQGTGVDQALLRAAVRHKLAKQGAVVAVMRTEAPESSSEADLDPNQDDGTTEAQDELEQTHNAAVINAAKEFLSTVEIPVVTTMEAAVRYLRTP